MKKINIIKKNKEFEELLKSKKVFKTPYFNIYIKDNNNIYNRYGISVTKKTGNAVIRNRIKRQIKDIIDKNIELKGNKEILIITRPKIIELNYVGIKENLMLIFEKIEKEK